ncbi:hypothetical protein E3N88_11595 [Mikania micrantha]|uniref:Uncharacterized protein n=1 Tax=Mikania micrantha TaxID=192012 RepID=A0A5N6PFV9_9ASTR|nr:hypothetical protein E3N88_11595 [Mikania micrantha]
MADGTRFKLLDDSVKGLQEFTHSLQLAQSAIKDAQHNMGLSQEALRSDVSELATSLEDQKKTMNKPNIQDLDSPKEENDQPKVRRSKREKKTSNKWNEFVCDATSA